MVIQTVIHMTIAAALESKSDVGWFVNKLNGFLPPITVRLFLYFVERSELLGYPFLSMAWGKLHDLHNPPPYKNPQNSMVHIQVAGVFDVFTKRKSFPKEKKHWHDMNVRDSHRTLQTLEG